MELNNKLKKELNEKLLSFVSQTFNKDEFINLELLKVMVEASNACGYEVAAIIDRRGKVVNLFVGEKNHVSITQELCSGYRLIHTHPNASCNLSELDKSLLRNKHLDCVCAVSIQNGIAFDAQAAFLLEDKIEFVNVANAAYINKYGLMEKLLTYAEQNKNFSQNVTNELNKAVLVVLELKKDDDAFRDYEELKNLATTANIQVVDYITQKRSKPDPRFVIGEGKLKELQNMIQLTNANLVIFDNELVGNKIFNLEKELGVKVIDRSMLILDIFAMRAKSNEGKLQVQLAQLKYSLPRLNSLQNTAGRFGGGVGMRGPGETKLELNRRIIERNIQKLEKSLKTVKSQRAISRINRGKSNKPIVSLVGYTNSGKSSLMNLLSNATVYVKNELFATLDTTTRKVWLDNSHEILLVDTVGFINKLPTEFIDAFSSTLEETIYADILLHVVDASNKNMEKQVEVVNALLNKLGVKCPIIMVYNKIDLINNEEDLALLEEKDGVCISAAKNINIEKLKNVLINTINKCKNI